MYSLSLNKPRLLKNSCATTDSSRKINIGLEHRHQRAYVGQTRCNQALTTELAFE